MSRQHKNCTWTPCHGRSTTDSLLHFLISKSIKSASHWLLRADPTWVCPHLPSLLMLVAGHDSKWESNTFQMLAWNITLALKLQWFPFCHSVIKTQRGILLFTVQLASQFYVQHLTLFLWFSYSLLNMGDP